MEQPLPKGGACNLCSINLSEYVKNPYTDIASFDFDSFSEDIPIIVKAMDDVLEENIERHALPIQRQMARDYRNLGIGIMGLADCFVKMKMVYGDKSSIRLSYKISSRLLYNAILASQDLAKERGAFPKYSEKMYDSDIIRNLLIGPLERLPLRNCSLISVAPTGSIGTMLNISTGVEPFFMLGYDRKTISLDDGKEKTYRVEIKALQECKKLLGIKETPDYFVTSSDVDYADRIKIQAALQEFTDTAISSTINLPKETTIKTVENLYLEAWMAGLKGVTIYRDGSRDPILSKITEEKEPKSKWVKRPKVLEADYYETKSRGEKFIVVVGIKEGLPYEIFAYKNIENLSFGEHKGKITKLKSGVYQFKSELLTIDNLVESNLDSNGRTDTLLISNILRHKPEMQHFMKVIKKADNSITSFVSALYRILVKYVPTYTTVCPECGGKLVHAGGCVKCTECGYDKCS